MIAHYNKVPSISTCCLAKPLSRVLVPRTKKRASGECRVWESLVETHDPIVPQT